MQITIQRPAQIGGQMTRISTHSTSIIIDLGHNLPGNDDKDALDNDSTIAELTQGCSAILYTHYHGDHIGLFHRVPDGIPQYIGPVAKQIVCRKYQQLCCLPEKESSAAFKHAFRTASNMKIFQAKQTLYFGDIAITPYFVSHSAYDSYMFLIEAEGKKILHTGDFRGHGYLSKGLEATLKYFVGKIDVLIIEGTMLARPEEKVRTEMELCQEATKQMNVHKYSFIHCSSTDIERLASFKNANNRIIPKRALITDVFQKDILDLFSRTAGKQSSCFDFGQVFTYNEHNQKLKEWMITNGFTMFVRATPKFHSYLDHLLPILPATETLFIYSMWNGYITNGSTQNTEYIRLQERFANNKILHLHTSGHATAEVLRKVCNLTNPRLAIIPIHREKSTDFKSIGISPSLQEKIITQDCSMEGIDVILASSSHTRQ